MLILTLGWGGIRQVPPLPIVKLPLVPLLLGERGLVGVLAPHGGGGDGHFIHWWVSAATMVTVASGRDYCPHWSTDQVVFYRESCPHP